MSLFCIVLVAVVICLHVAGGAVGFAKIFPRESAWWGYFVPVLAIVALLNFIEHAVALPELQWLLPVGVAGSLWLVARSRLFRVGPRLLPGLLFAGIFVFTLSVKCLEPDINYYCTEGLTDLNRILDFCLGDRVPPRDSWLPPYPHTAYYTFMHYGASVLKRYLHLDIGTAYNFGSAFVSAMTLLAVGAVAHTVGRGRIWLTVLMVVVMAGGFTGSTPIHALLHPLEPDPAASTDVGLGYDDPVHAEFAWLLKRASPNFAYRIYTPGAYIYYSEFHATMAGHLLALLTVFAAAQLLRRKRANFPWIFLLAVPFLAYITCTWFVVIVALIAAPTLMLAWTIGRRPASIRTVAIGTGIALALIAPTSIRLMHDAAPQEFSWTHNLPDDIWTVLIQWWPVFIPWLALCVAWRRLDFTARWLHFLLVPLCLAVEAFYFSERGTTLEKTWSGAFGVAVAILYPILFLQRDWSFRTVSAAMVLTGLISLFAWTYTLRLETLGNDGVLRLQGDAFFQREPTLKRMQEVLALVRGQTVLTGVEARAWYRSPAMAAFTENRCYLGWANAEETCGHAVEAHRRMDEVNAFYAGTQSDPLAFLARNGIGAILVWPEDKLTPVRVAQLRQQLAPDYIYLDCRRQPDETAGVFLQKAILPER